MTNLTDRDEARVAFLLALYEAVDGNTTSHVGGNAVGARIGLSEIDSQQTIQWLSDHHMAQRVSMGGTIAITAYGVDEAESRLREGRQVPLSIVVLTAEELQAVEVFLGEYRRAGDEGRIPLRGEELAEADAEVRTIEAQSKSPRPKRRVIRASVRELHALLQSTAGSGLWQLLEGLVQRL